jgi:hypothetical protein
MNDMAMGVLASDCHDGNAQTWHDCIVQGHKSIAR